MRYRTAVQLVMVGTLCVLAASALAEEAKLNPFMTKELTGLAGKEGTMFTVEYAPGGSDAKHRHNAHTFVYVLEGSIVMQVEGGKEVTLGPGQTFYESPTDIQHGLEEREQLPAREVCGLYGQGEGCPDRLASAVNETVCNGMRDAGGKHGDPDKVRALGRNEANGRAGAH